MQNLGVEIMQVSRVQGNNQAFKSLYVGQKLANTILYSSTSTKFLSDFSTIKTNILTNKLDHKRFVDIILDVKHDRFYAVIASKEQGIPNNPNNKIIIETTKKGLAKFKKWVNEWNHAYNPKTIEQFQKLDKLIKNADWKNSNLDKALKALQE